MIFEFMMGYFRRNARLVVGGHVTEPQETITYVSVVLRKIVGIDLTLSGLKDLPVNVADI